MKRRHWVLGGAGLLAGVGGVAWQRARQPQPAGAAAAPAASAAAPDSAVSAFWESSFDKPDGTPLAMSSLRGAPLLLNFWATWCPPCVKEMPELDRFAREVAARGIRVLGLAIDAPTPVRAFLARTPVSYPIVLAGFDGTELSRRLGNERGALPFSVLLDRRGAIVQRKLGQTDSTELAAWVAAL